MRTESIEQVMYLQKIVCSHNSNNLGKYCIRWDTYKKKQLHKIYNKIDFLLRILIKNFDMILSKKRKEMTLLTTLLTVRQLTISKVDKTLYREQCAHMLNTYKYASLTSSVAGDAASANCVEYRILHNRYVNNSVVTARTYQAYIFSTCLLTHIIHAKSCTRHIEQTTNLYTVLRSPHTDKKAREQFVKKTHGTIHLIRHCMPIMNAIEYTIRNMMHELMCTYKYGYVKIF